MALFPLVKAILVPASFSRYFAITLHVSAVSFAWHARRDATSTAKYPLLLSDAPIVDAALTAPT